MADTPAIARRFLETLEARDWDAWTTLMVPGVVYELPQTPRAGPRAGKLPPVQPRLPGGVAPDHALDAQVFLEFDADGMITAVTDFWPEPYDPPARPEGARGALRVRLTP